MIKEKSFSVQNEELYCVNAQNGLRVYNDGTAMLCCMSKQILDDVDGNSATVKTHTLNSLRNGKKATSIKQSLKQGIKHKNCERCWNEEAAGLQSKRIRDNAEYETIFNDDKLKFIELNLGTTCNVKCRICGPWSSSQWNKEFLLIDQWSGTKKSYNEWLYKFNHSYDDDSFFWKDFKNNLKTLEKIDMYGGEPFLVKKQWEMLEYSISQGYSVNQRLHFNTNGTKFEWDKIPIMAKFKNVDLSLSIDGIDKHFEYQRHPAVWSDVYKNILNFKKVTIDNNWNLRVCITVNNYNIFYLDKIMNYFKSLEIIPYLNFLHDAPRYNVMNLREDIKTYLTEKYSRLLVDNHTKMWLQKAVEYMNLKESSDSHWTSFLMMTEKLDKIRNENFKEVFPEYASIIYEKQKWQPLRYTWLKNNLKYLHIELSNYCNSACPMCPRYVFHTEKVDPTLNLDQITNEKFKKYFPVEFLKNIERITFCGTHGDPMMAKDFYEIVTYIYDVNPDMTITVNTNGGIRSVNFWKKLGEFFKNKKHEFTFSIDGLEDTNHLYRRNVNFKKVLENAKAFIEAGGVALWDYLIFQHNEHQIEAARQLAKDVGFKTFFAKRALGFATSTNGNYKSSPVYDRDGNFLYWLSPPKNTDFLNSGKTLIDDNVPTKVDVIGYVNHRDNLDLKILDKKYKEHNNKNINCKFLNKGSYTELYINANGVVLPCCFMGSAVTGNFGEEQELQIRKIIDTNKNKLDLNLKSMYEILDSKILDDIFVSKWKKQTFQEGKPVFCAITCGENNGIDRIFIDKK